MAPNEQSVIIFMLGRKPVAISKLFSTATDVDCVVKHIGESEHWQQITCY